MNCEELRRAKESVFDDIFPALYDRLDNLRGYLKQLCTLHNDRIIDEATYTAAVRRTELMIYATEKSINCVRSVWNDFQIEDVPF